MNPGMKKGHLWFVALLCTRYGVSVVSVAGGPGGILTRNVRVNDPELWTLSYRPTLRRRAALPGAALPRLLGFDWLLLAHRLLLRQLAEGPLASIHLLQCGAQERRYKDLSPHVQVDGGVVDLLDQFRIESDVHEPRCLHHHAQPPFQLTSAMCRDGSMALHVVRVKRESTRYCKQITLFPNYPVRRASATKTAVYQQGDVRHRVAG